MGLFITKALVERHGGDLRIESWLGEGTTVTIRLPSDRLVPVFANPPSWPMPECRPKRRLSGIVSPASAGTTIAYH